MGVKKNDIQFQSKSEAFLERNNVLIRSIIFLAVALLFKFGRIFITKYVYGYEVEYNDSYARFALIGLIPLFWFSCWDKIKNDNYRSDTAIATLMSFGVSLIALFFPAHLFVSKTINGLILGELITGFIREVSLLFMYFGRDFFKKFRYELFLMTFVIVFLEFSEYVTEKYWQYSSALTFGALQYIVPHLGMPFDLEQSTFFINLNGFRIIIGAPCAGIQSLTAFTSLFVLTLLMLRKRGVRIRTISTLFWYLVGAFIVYTMNSLRVLLILLVGALYSQEFAINMFHSAIGAILFLGFFVLYIKLALPRIVKKRAD